MILTVALNATVNVSYEAEEIAWGAPNQISRMTSRAGGGSLAVARVLAAWARRSWWPASRAGGRAT